MSVALAFTVVSTVEHAAGILTQLLGLAAMAALFGGAVAVAYRWYAGSVAPTWLATLVGLASVALYLGTTPALEAVVREGVEPSEPAIALFNVGGLAAGVGGAVLGHRVGDRFGCDVVCWSPTLTVDEEVSKLAQTVGQVTTVELPARIHDAAGYDPIPERSKERLAGETFVFPRGLSVEELRDRVTDRLRSDYGVGAIDIEFDDDGNVSYLGVGTRAAGIGATLPPATNAIAVRADPGFSASTGDIVQVWEPEQLQRVLTGELRGIADDVVTIAIDAADTPRVDPTRRYRLVTLPVNDRPDREFASLLRAADETFSSVTVEAGSPLHGMPVGALDLTVTAIRPDAGDPVPFPESTYRMAPGDLLFVIARPAGVRRLQTAAEPLDPTLASTSLPADEKRPAEGIQTAGTETERSQPTGEDGLPATDDGNVPGDDDTAEESIVRGKADSDSFQEIKAQFEEADAEASPEEGSAADDAEGTAAASSDTSSFDDLKAEFESGGADWDEDDGGKDTHEVDDTTEPTDEAETVVDPVAEEDLEVAFEDDTESTDDSELVSLDEAEIDFGEQAQSAESSDPIDIDEDLQGDPPEKISDDIGNLDIDGGETGSDGIDNLDLEEDSGLFDLEEDVEGKPKDEKDVDGETDEDDEETGEDADEETGQDGGIDEEDQEDDKGDEEDDSRNEEGDNRNEDGDGDDEDDGSSSEDSGSSGGSSFAALKEEFESGEADWEEDIDDSPGGDMRLDE